LLNDLKKVIKWTLALKSTPIIEAECKLLRMGWKWYFGILQMAEMQYQQILKNFIGILFW